MREVRETPKRMITGGRASEFGVFKSPFREINLLDTDITVGGKHLPRFARDLRLKEWEHFGIVHDEHYFGMVIFDAKFMSTSFCYVFNRKNKEFFEHSRTGVGTPLKVARELWDADCYFNHIGYRLRFENRLEDGYHHLTAKIKGTGRKPGVDADVRILDDPIRFEPLVVVNPLKKNRLQYTHKSASPVEGTIHVGGVQVELDPLKHVGLMDVQKSFFWYRTAWKWATFGGFDDRGRLVGINLCEGIVEDDDEYNENCTWVDGKMTPLSAARFEFNESALLGEWRIRTVEGELDVTFKPEGERKGKINLGVLMSDFHQPFGEFKGKIPAPDGSLIDVEKMFGVCEYHLARF